MFCMCEGLKKVPDGLFDPLTKLKDISNVFAYCNSLEYLPSNLFSKCKHIRIVDGLFYQNKSVAV